MFGLGIRFGIKSINFNKTKNQKWKVRIAENELLVRDGTPTGRIKPNFEPLKNH